MRALGLLMMLTAACAGQDNTDLAVGAGRDDDGPRFLIEPPGFAATIDLDEVGPPVDEHGAVDKLRDARTGVQSVIGMGWQLKNDYNNCSWDLMVDPPVKYGCTATKTKFITANDFINNSTGQYCGHHWVAQLDDGYNSPCATANQYNPRWKYKIADSCQGDMRPGIRRGVNAFNAMMANNNIPWNFDEVDSGEGLTVYCSDLEPGMSTNFALAYPWSAQNITPIWAPTSSSSRCGNSGPRLMNNVGHWYNYTYYAIAMSSTRLFNAFGVDGECWGHKPSSMQGWEFIERSVGGIMMHELGHLVGLHHVEHSTDDIMQQWVSCDSYQYLGKTFDGRILDAIRKFDSLPTGWTPSNGTYDAELECLGIDGR